MQANLQGNGKLTTSPSALRRFDANNNKTANATFVKVVWNGQIIHENVEVAGVTRGAMLADEVATGPLLLQGDHGPVAYRNVVLTPIDD